VSARSLSAAGALAWLASLSLDLRATCVLGAGGACLAGDPELGRRAAAVLDAGPGTPAEARVGDVIAVRSARHTVAATVGPQALERLVRADLRAALDALDRA
jgi:hypothetical protein